MKWEEDSYEHGILDGEKRLQMLKNIETVYSGEIMKRQSPYLQTLIYEVEKELAKRATEFKEKLEGMF